MSAYAPALHQTYLISKRVVLLYRHYGSKKINQRWVATGTKCQYFQWPRMSNPAMCLLINLIFMFMFQQSCTSTLYMIMEYNTDGTVILNNANFTLHTVSMNVTLLGCDYGYYDHYMLFPPLVSSPRTKITPFDCRPCTCTAFESVRSEEFVITG